jgi:cyclic pyranopterin phosphate synthase
MTGLYDSWQRQINYLRISITDFCNLNCVYCTEGNVPKLPREEILSYEEIRRLIVVAASMGINKVRLTGGEPLMRPDLTHLVRMISGTAGIDDIALTTNGTLLSKYAVDLKDAGLTRVNVSLDTLKPERFKKITGHDNLRQVLDGIELAERVALTPVKVNMVVMRGENDDEVIDFARKTIDSGWNVRYIEYMPFSASVTESARLVSTREIKKRLDVLGHMERCGTERGNGPARYFRFPGARGTVGFISPITEHFCATCNRLRMTSDGHLRPCLLDDDEIDIKKALRNGGSDEDLKAIIERAVVLKRERHHLNEGEKAPERPMRQIGG